MRKIETEISIKYYIAMFIVAVLIFLLSLICKCEEVSGLLSGFAMGVFSSTIIGFLDDYMHTNKKNEQELKIYNRLTDDFFYSCRELNTEFIVAAQEAIGIDDEKRTFFQWAEILLGDNNADNKVLDEADYALQQISEIRRNSSKLLLNSSYYLENKYFNEKFSNNIKRILDICTKIEREHKRKNYSMCLRYIKNELIQTIAKIDNNYEGLYEIAFNWDDE